MNDIVEMDKVILEIANQTLKGQLKVRTIDTDKHIQSDFTKGNRIEDNLFVMN